MDHYSKSGGSAGSKGVKYQVNLLTTVLLNVLHRFQGTNWRISTEQEKAGKFDDLVFEGPDGDILLQAKSREKNKRITLEQLFSTNSKQADFSLAKYFLSYLELKNNFRVKNLILCTNVEMNEKVMKIVDRHDDIESILHYSNDYCFFYTFSNDNLPILKEKIIEYHTNNSKSKASFEPTDEDITEFLKIFQIYPSYPRKGNFEKYIKQSLLQLKLSNKLFERTSFQDIHIKVKEWFEQPKGQYLTESCARAMVCEIRSEKFCDMLESYNEPFAHNDFVINDDKRMYHYHIESGYFLHLLKIHQTLKDRDMKTLYVDPVDESDEQMQTIEAFEQSHIETLVIVCPKITELPSINKLCQRIKEILDHRRYKKVVLLAEPRNIFAKHVLLLDYDCHITKSTISFDNHSTATQETLLKRTNIIFQGHITSLEEVFKPLSLKADFKKYLCYETLESLIKNDEIVVGSKLQPSNEPLYIPRNFNRKLEGRTELYAEENLYTLEDKMILITDSAGMGKSTTLTKLAVDIKSNHPHLWVIKIELNDCTKLLRDALKEKRDTIRIEELLIFSGDVSLQSNFEKSIFSIEGKIVLLLDGVDEICPDYTHLVVNMIAQCYEALNFEKIFVTTRPYLSKILEEEFNVKPLMFEPLSEANQIEYLTNYWAYNKTLQGRDQTKSEKYAELLIDEISSWTDTRYVHFGNVPLLVRMLAEISQDKTTFKPKSAEKMNLLELYEMFVEKKREIFLDKSNPTGNTTANHALNKEFDESVRYHEIFAVELMFGETVRNYFTCYEESGIDTEVTLLKIGIVQKTNDKFQYIHKTFAEFFVAKSLVKELQNQNPTIEFQDFFMKYLVKNSNSGDDKIIEFLESCLQTVGQFLPYNFFQNYSLSKLEIDRHMAEESLSIIHNLVRENMIFILQFILNCLNADNEEQHEAFNKSIFVKDFCTIQFWDQSVLVTNLFNILQLLVKYGGINIIQEYYGYTPLHVASQQGWLEMAQFLVSQGANIYIKDFQGCTPLILAACQGHVNIVRYLIDVDANLSTDETNLQVYDTYVNMRNRNGDTALHEVALRGYSGIAELLVHCGADVRIQNVHGNTALHNCVTCGYEDIVSLLVSDSCVNIQNEQGNTALHQAVLCGDLDILKLLLRYANVDVMNNVGSTSLHRAALNGHLDIARLLVECGADVGVQNDSGDTALHISASGGYKDIVKLLIEYRADVQIQNEDGDTALHEAVTYGHFDTVVLLLQTGVGVNIRNGDGNKAVDIATSYGYHSIATLLMENS